MLHSEMSIRERWIAAITFSELDRLPFWPKITKGYENKYGGGLWDKIKWDRPGPGYNPIKYAGQKCSEKVSMVDDRKITEYITPNGTLRAVEHYDAASSSYHPIEFPVKCAEDIKLLTDFFRDRISIIDTSIENQTDMDESTFCPFTTCHTSPMMLWLQHQAGIDNGHFFLMDHQKLVEELFDAMQASISGRADKLSEITNAELIFMSENTSTTLISPDQYRRYCKKHLIETGDIIHKNGRRMCLHMCGFIRDLLTDINEVNADAFEALTPPPVANTTFADARKECPRVCLIGGTGATTWLKPINKIIEEIEMRLDELPDHRGIVVSSGGVLPPDCPPDKVIKVFDWIKSYKPRL